MKRACHLGHDFWTVDEEEESSSLVGHGPRNQGFATSRRSIPFPVEAAWHQSHPVGAGKPKAELQSC